MWGEDHTTEYVTATQAFTGFQWDYKVNSFLGGVFAGGSCQIMPRINSEEFSASSAEKFFLSELALDH